MTRPDERSAFLSALQLSSPVVRIDDVSVLDEVVARLRGYGTDVTTIDCSKCDSRDALFLHVTRSLGFDPVRAPSQDQFRDYCHHIEVDGDGGHAIVLGHYDRVLRERPIPAHFALHTLALASWWNLVQGRRLVPIVHVEDRRLEIDPVGASEPTLYPHGRG